MQGVYGFGFETITQEVGARDFLQAWELEFSSPYLFSEGKEKEKLMYVRGNENICADLCCEEKERFMYVHGTRILPTHFVL